MYNKVDAISAVDICNLSFKVFVPLVGVADNSNMHSVFIKTQLFDKFDVLGIEVGGAFYASVVGMNIEDGVAGCEG